MLPAGSIVLDAQGAQSPHHRERGIARYTVEQIRGVLDLAPDAVRAVALNPRLPMAQSLDFLLGREILEWAHPHERPAGGPPVGRCWGSAHCRILRPRRKSSDWTIGSRGFSATARTASGARSSTPRICSTV